MKNIIKYGFTQSPLVSCSPIITSHQSKTCNEVANHADFCMVDRAFKALQNGIKYRRKQLGFGYFVGRILVEIGVLEGIPCILTSKTRTFMKTNIIF